MIKPIHTQEATTVLILRLYATQVLMRNTFNYLTQIMKGGCRYSSKGTYKVHCSTPNAWLSVTQQIIFRVQQ